MYIFFFECLPTAASQELCESRGGRPGLPYLMTISLTVSVDVKQHLTMSSKVPPRPPSHTTSLNTKTNPESTGQAA